MEKNKGIKDRERLPDSDNTNKKLSLGGIGGRKLMVLGGNIVQMEATLEAKRQGYYVISADLHEDNPGHKVADEYWCKSPYREHIEIIKGDAGEVLCSLKPPEEGFDFVFIDAAKGQYLDYFQKIQPFLSSKAVIVADNVLFRGYVLGDEKPPRRYKTIVKRLRAYLDLVKHTPGFRTKILENGDGLSVTYKDILEEKS